MTSINFLRALWVSLFVCIGSANDTWAQTTGVGSAGTEPVELPVDTGWSSGRDTADREGRDTGDWGFDFDVSTLRCRDVVAHRGDDFAVDVELDTLYPIISFEFDLSYDRDTISPRATGPRYVPVDGASAFTLSARGLDTDHVRLSARVGVPEDAIPAGSGTIVRVLATIPPEAAHGVYDIDVSTPYLLSDTRVIIETEVESCTLTIPHPDADGDGYEEDVDCDDTDPETHPDAEDIPDDGIDQDCDGADATTEVDDDGGDTGAESSDPGDSPGDSSGDEGGDGPATWDPSGTDLPEEDDDAPTAGDKAGCSCASAGGPGPLAWLLGLTGLAMTRRRR